MFSNTVSKQSSVLHGVQKHAMVLYALISVTKPRAYPHDVRLEHLSDDVELLLVHSRAPDRVWITRGALTNHSRMEADGAHLERNAMNAEGEI